MKNTIRMTIAVLAAALLSTSAYAREVPGAIFYVDNSGELVKRELTIDVPSHGQGKVILRGKNIRWESTNFFRTKTHGKVTFHVNFEPEWQGKRKHLHFVGTYIRGTNKLVYYGDFYKRDANGLVKHGGGFYFKYDRQEENK